MDNNYALSTLGLSIIIPVYNVAEYLDRCVKSVLSQDYCDYEIILVDDGSTDGSGHLCDELAKQHAHISVIHKPNGGLSSARNAGLKVARGQYIWFIDSDDYIAEQSLGEVMHQIKSDLSDILFFSFIHTNGVSTIGLPQGKYCQGYYTGGDLVRDHMRRWSACSYVSRRSLWVDNDIFFLEGICFEDLELMPRLLQNVSRASFFESDSPVYYYYVRPGSIMRQIDLSKKFAQIGDYFRIEQSWNDSFNLVSPKAESYDMFMLKIGTNVLHRNLLNFVRNTNFSIYTKLKLYAQYRKKGVFSWYYNGYRRDPYVGRISIRVFWNTVGRSCILFSLFSCFEEIIKKIKNIIGN